MGWLLWGVVVGWAAASFYYESQEEEKSKAGSGSVVIFILLITLAVAISLSIGLKRGVIPAQAPTPTIELGR